MESSGAVPDITAPSNNQSQKHNHMHPHGLVASTTPILLILLPIMLLFLLVAILVLIIMLRRLRSNKSTTTSSDEGGNSHKFIAPIHINKIPGVKKKHGRCLYGGESSRRKRVSGVQVFTYKELESATNNFSQGNVIGNDGFGMVYRGVLSDGTAAAIKALRREGKHGERAFRIEVDLLSRLHSPHLVALLGYCADQQHRLLIFELMPNGSLQQHLYSNNNDHTTGRGRGRWSLDWGTRIRMALDCARALEYLHERATPPIIHRDLQCSNILLDQDFRAKVSGFGLAKMGSDTISDQISTRVLGTTGFLAPEWVLSLIHLFHS